MKNPIKTYFEWEEQRWQTVGIKQWEQQRKVGKFIFALKFALPFGVITNVVLILFDYFLFSGIKLDAVLLRALVLFILAFIGLLIVWSISEGKYQKHLEEKS